MRYVAERDEEAVLCACKRTRSPPFCDGTHNDLSATYAEAAPGDYADVREVGFEAFTDRASRQARLDNGCYVLRPAPPDGANGANGADGESHDGLRLSAAISPATGARHLAQYVAWVAPGVAPPLAFPGSETVVFYPDGVGDIEISGRRFAMPAETGAYVRQEEAFRLGNHGDAVFPALITVCPGDAEPTFPAAMPDNFAAAQPTRARAYAPGQRDAMADRFLQELVNKDLGCERVTQFIGEIPRSRAAHHRHLYEEALYILSGSGMMWTDTVKAPVMPGDIVFLPAKQAHSLECASAEGMRLMGVFYPAGSPKVNY